MDLRLLAKIGVKTPVCFIGAFNPRDKSRGNSTKNETHKMQVTNLKYDI